MILIHGLYRWSPKRVAFRNDFCLKCAQPRRAVQIRTLNAVHLFWIPILPLGLWKRWLCTVCGSNPHEYPGTRRPFKWIGLILLTVLGLVSWLEPIQSD